MEGGDVETSLPTELDLSFLCRSWYHFHIEKSWLSRQCHCHISANILNLDKVVSCVNASRYYGHSICGVIGLNI